MTKEYPYFKCYQADFEELMIDAVRYALPRPSYVTGNISELLRKYMDRIGKEALMQIRIDILNQKLIYGIPGDWDVLFGLPIDEKITKCFRERFGLWDAECVG